MPSNNSLIARCDVKFLPETRLEPELESVLRSYFSESLIKTLESVGGTISINLLFSTQKKPKEVSLDNKFVEFLQSFSGDERELRDRLEPLSTGKLTNLTRQLKIPVRSNATASERVTAIVSYILSSKKWTGISGKSPASHSGHGGSAAAE
jgi:hypothetical protein